MTWMPSSLAWCGVSRSCPAPASVIVPPGSGACTPERILIRVDLPEPFSPTRQCTSPGATDQSMLSRARVPPNRFVLFASERRGRESAAEVANEKVPSSSDSESAAYESLLLDALHPGPVETGTATRRSATQSGRRTLGRSSSADLGPFVDRLRVQIDLLVGADHAARCVDLAGPHTRQVD